MAPLPASDCDTCAEHQATKLLIKQHEDRLHELEEHYMDISNDNSNLEGRVTMFIWIVILFDAQLGQFVNMLPKGMEI